MPFGNFPKRGNISLGALYALYALSMYQSEVDSGYKPPSSGVFGDRDKDMLNYVHDMGVSKDSFVSEGIDALSPSKKI